MIYYYNFSPDSNSETSLKSSQYLTKKLFHFWATLYFITILALLFKKVNTFTQNPEGSSHSI